MSDWKEYKLGEVSKFSQGIQVPIEEQKNLPFDGGVRFIRIVDFTNNDIKDIRYISDPGSKYLVEKDDLVMIRYGSQTAGKIARGFRGVIANNTFKITPDETILDKGFLFYLLSQKSIYDFFRSSQSSSTMPAITFGQVGDLKIKVPPINIQVVIANILSSLDDKIELNNKINQELESLAQLLFKRWFVDFEFPNENGEPYKSSGGKMEDSELGEIPKGWNILSLESATTEITRGFTTSYVEKSNLINLNQKVNRGSFLDKSNFKYYSDETIVPNNKYAKKQDILINSLGQGTLGRIHFYLEDTNNVVVDQHITIVRANNFKVLPEILYLTLTLDTNIERMSNMVTGSTGMLMLNISKIREFKVIAPPIKIQSEIAKVVYSLYEKINLNLQENEGLSKMRDCLIPKLISGELQINDN